MSPSPADPPRPADRTADADLTARAGEPQSPPPADRLDRAGPIIRPALLYPELDDRDATRGGNPFTL